MKIFFKGVKEFFVELETEINNIINELEKEIEEQRLNLSDKIYKDLTKIYENLQSEEAIIDALECNDYEFDIEGNII